MSMNEQNIQALVEGIVRTVLAESNAGRRPPCHEPAPGNVCHVDVIPVELSARHAHLSEEHALELFGAPLTPARELSQPGQFLCKQRVRLIGPRGVMDNVAVLGPSRNCSQVEISRTDARILGVEVPVRQSGAITGTPGIIIASETGIVGLEEGLIVAMRHIHMSCEDAARFGVVDNDLIAVRLNGERPVVLENVLVRVSASFRLALHIDADEGNSSGWNKNVTGTIVSENIRF